LPQHNRLLPHLLLPLWHRQAKLQALWHLPHKLQALWHLPPLLPPLGLLVARLVQRWHLLDRHPLPSHLPHKLPPHKCLALSHRQHKPTHNKTLPLLPPHNRLPLVKHPPP
jgi:hypothetical protein